MNWYLITNIICGFLWGVFLLISLAMEGFKWTKISIKHMAIISLLVALNVVLTNLISYNIPLFGNGVKIAAGDWLLFLIGMIFGPLLGWVGVFCADNVGSIVNLGGTYHCGYMLDKFLLAFMGSLVFLSKKNKMIYFKIIFLYGISLMIESFVFNPIWLASQYGWGIVIPSFATKAIKYFVVLPIYVSLVIASLKALKSILINWQTSTYIWCLRNDYNWELNNKKTLNNLVGNKNTI